MATKEAAVEGLKALSPEQPLSNCPQYMEWYHATRETAETSPRAQIDFIMEDARVRKEGGRIAEAKEALEQALEYAWNMHEDALAEEIKQELQVL